jgi:hypothetical protein
MRGDRPDGLIDSRRLEGHLHGEPMLTIADVNTVYDIAFGPYGRTLAAVALSGLIVWELSPA